MDQPLPSPHAHAGIVAALSWIISDQMRRGVPLSAALLVAIVFNPARLQLQRFVDRAFYGTGADPAGTARHVAAQLQQSDELADTLDRTRKALKLPWIALDRLPDGTRLAQAGTPSTGALATIDLNYRGCRSGRCTCGSAAARPRCTTPTVTTLDLICTPLAIALHGAVRTGTPGPRGHGRSRSR